VRRWNEIILYKKGIFFSSLKMKGNGNGGVVRPSPDSMSHRNDLIRVHKKKRGISKGISRGISRRKNT
jgi:hypothetical protein